MAMLQGSNCDQICSVVKETGFTVPVGSARGLMVSCNCCLHQYLLFNYLRDWQDSQLI